jgi:hypothetical protein
MFCAEDYLVIDLFVAHCVFADSLPTRSTDCIGGYPNLSPIGLLCKKLASPKGLNLGNNGYNPLDIGILLFCPTDCIGGYPNLSPIGLLRKELATLKGLNLGNNGCSPLNFCDASDRHFSVCFSRIDFY